MRKLVLCLCLAATSGPGQWSAPMALPHDSADDLACTAVAIDDSSLFAAWVSRYGFTEYEIRGSMYNADSGRWTGLRRFATRSAEIAMTGPGLSTDPLRNRLWVAYYKGAFPVDQDSWGVYTAYADSAGISPSELTMSDTGVSAIVLRHNGAGQTGMVWTDIAGTPPDFYSSVWFSQLDGDTWRARRLVAGGSAMPLTDCTEPALCADTGDRFFVAWTRIVPIVPSYRVHIAGLPDTTTLGVFPGSSPAIVSDLHGTLLETNVQTVNTERLLLARMYRAGNWTAPETISRTATPGVRQRMCVDTAGIFWVIYTEGVGQPMTLLARYYQNDGWSTPETVAVGGVYNSPVIVSTYSSQLWAVWQGQDTDTGRIFSSRRLGRPGVGSGPMREASRDRIEARPNPFRTTVNLRLPTGAQRVNIYDATGRLVRSLSASGDRSAAGVVWDGTDRTGRRVCPGLYCVREPVSGASTTLILR
ncbi:MAG: FlgD immunoglobulin-like domain containing protein [candidate division WOR-3 bacterium]